jgi:nanoRNase/pAp phosphatase (c-di-AMP/oligoRNAs hydrolase)
LVVAVEEVMAVVVMAVVVMEEVVTVTEDADTDADIMEEVMEEVGMAGEVGAGGPSMAGLIAEANPVLIIFSKSLNDHPFSQ